MVIPTLERQRSQTVVHRGGQGYTYFITGEEPNCRTQGDRVIPTPERQRSRALVHCRGHGHGHTVRDTGHDNFSKLAPKQLNREVEVSVRIVK